MVTSDHQMSAFLKIASGDAHGHRHIQSPTACAG